MARDTNLNIKSGRLTRDPEMKTTPSGKAVCNFALACNDSKEKVNFFECQAWEKTAEIITEYCKKGMKILIVGRDDQQRWDGDDGKKHTKQIINVQSFEFMGGKSSDEIKPKPETEFTTQPDGVDDNIPF